MLEQNPAALIGRQLLFEAGVLELQTTALEALSNLSSAYQSVQAMENTVLPGARATYDSVKKAYRAGEVDYIELLDAQRTLVESQSAHLDLFADLQLQRVEFERLTALSPAFQEHFLNHQQAE